MDGRDRHRDRDRDRVEIEKEIEIEIIYVCIQAHGSSSDRHLDPSGRRRGDVHLKAPRQTLERRDGRNFWLPIYSI